MEFLHNFKTFESITDPLFSIDDVRHHILGLVTVENKLIKSY